MISRKDIEKLASLARISLKEEEKDSLPKEIDSILKYVGQIKSVSDSLSKKKEVGLLHNVMREDVVLNESGEYTKELVAEMPKKSGNYLKVKKILP